MRNGGDGIDRATLWMPSYRENPYEILGIPGDSDRDAIIRAYRKLAKKHHPDTCSSLSADEQAVHAEKFREARWACNEALDNFDNMGVNYGYDREDRDHTSGFSFMWSGDVWDDSLRQRFSNVSVKANAFAQDASRLSFEFWVCWTSACASFFTTPDSNEKPNGEKFDPYGPG